MLRDKNLVPLSRQHQHALALCVRIDRAAEAGAHALEQWQAEMQAIYEQEIGAHFAAEEEHIFPAVEALEELRALAQELRREHARLREIFGEAAERKLDWRSVKAFGVMLAGHIRKEERQLFEGMQGGLRTEQIEKIGTAVEKALENATRACALPKRGAGPGRNQALSESGRGSR
jgi:hemerythrin-like domain-containing protein